MENDETSSDGVEEHDANKRPQEGDFEGKEQEFREMEQAVRQEISDLFTRNSNVSTEIPDVSTEFQEELKRALSQKDAVKDAVYAIVHKKGIMFPVLVDERIHGRLAALATMGFEPVPVAFPDPSFMVQGLSVCSLFVAARDEGWALKKANKFVQRRRKELEQRVDELKKLNRLEEAVFGEM